MDTIVGGVIGGLVVAVLLGLRSLLFRPRLIVRGGYAFPPDPGHSFTFAMSVRNFSLRPATVDGVGLTANKDDVLLNMTSGVPSLPQRLWPLRSFRFRIPATSIGHLAELQTGRNLYTGSVLQAWARTIDRTLYHAPEQFTW